MGLPYLFETTQGQPTRRIELVVDLWSSVVVQIITSLLKTIKSVT